MPPRRADPSAAWQTRLVEVVDEQGRVDYTALAADRAALDAYVAWLAARAELPDAPQARLAFWINAYNALVLFAVLEEGLPFAEGGPRSVRDVEGVLPVPGSGFFLERAFVVAGSRFSLWDIEHERIRLRSMDLRVHAAISCASASCPPLSNELYDRDRLDSQLDRAMRDWIRDPERGARVVDDRVELPALFDWYARDFSFWSGGLDPCAVVAPYASPADRQALRRLSERGCPRVFRPYDWSLAAR